MVGSDANHNARDDEGGAVALGHVRRCNQKKIVAQARAAKRAAAQSGGGRGSAGGAATALRAKCRAPAGRQPVPSGKPKACKPCRKFDGQMATVHVCIIIRCCLYHAASACVCLCVCVSACVCLHGSALLHAKI